MTDAVKMLGVRPLPTTPTIPPHPGTLDGSRRDYTRFLDRDGLKGARIGIVESFSGRSPVHAEVTAVIREAITRMEQAGAVMVPVDDPIFDTSRLVAEVSVHLYDLKSDLNSYLSDPKAPRARQVAGGDYRVRQVPSEHRR